MYEVRLLPSRGPARSVRVEAGTSLAEAVRAAGLPLARGCRSGGLCGRCSLRVLDGAQDLSPEVACETRAKQRNRVASEERLACQARVHGPVGATASYW